MRNLSRYGAIVTLQIQTQESSSKKKEDKRRKIADNFCNWVGTGTDHVGLMTSWMTRFRFSWLCVFFVSKSNPF